MTSTATNGRPLAGLVRSSDGAKRRQEAGTYHADEEQVHAIERYATGIAPVVFLEPELDVSGGLPLEQRPALRAAIEGVEAGEFSGIIVAYLSRLSRSRSGIAIWDRIEAAGGHVHSAAENLDTSTPNGRFVRDIHLANAVREREEHVERFANRRAATNQAGIFRLATPPRGYVFAGPADATGRYRGRARRLVPDPIAAAEVREAARDFLAGASIGALADRLQMAPNGIRALLRNRCYLGELRDGENINAAAHEPILTPELFAAVAERLAHGARPARGDYDGPALLAGIAVCGGCGYALSRRQRRSVVYSCVGQHRNGRCPAPASITVDRLDAYVEEIAARAYAKLQAGGDARCDIGDADSTVEEARRRFDALVAMVGDAGLDKRDVADELRERKAAVVAAEQRLEAARARSAAPVSEPGSEAYDSLSPGGKNQVLRGLLAGVVVFQAGRGGRPAVEDRVLVVPAAD